ncbi:unnamed protein product [Hymenolepis diminuta]|uniref:BHLH domain-containing protein n=1 Tax=Hymenolepis diminuta TaxID=6216 RepID=A0A564Z8C8_HYMDI|nr:unnamed protein product [Hymenolepis diminuta]
MTNPTLRVKSKGKSSHRRNKKREMEREIKRLRNIIPGLGNRSDIDEADVIYASIAYMNKLEIALMNRKCVSELPKIDHLERNSIQRNLLQNSPRVEALIVPTVQSSGVSPCLTSDDEDNN